MDNLVLCHSIVSYSCYFTDVPFLKLSLIPRVSCVSSQDVRLYLPKWTFKIDRIRLSFQLFTSFIWKCIEDRVKLSHLRFIPTIHIFCYSPAWMIELLFDFFYSPRNQIGIRNLIRAVGTAAYDYAHAVPYDSLNNCDAHLIIVV